MSASTAASIAFTPLGPHMAMAVHGIDLRRRPDADMIARLRQALWDHQVLCIRGQDIEPGDFLAAVSLFGTPEIRPEIPHVPGFPAVTTLSSEDRDTKGDGKRLVAGANWHTDDSFMAAPSALTALYGVIVPNVGGDTEFANMYAAYEALPETMKRRLNGMKAIHMMKPDRPGIGRTRTIAPEILAQRPPSTHPVVRTHPETGRKALYVSRNRIDHIVGMDRDEGHRLIDDLVAHATQPRFVYRHKWQQGDLVIWDNRCLMHKANGDYPQGARRFMRRIICAGDVPV
ncbi:MAG: TauD/TfdA dioxygenase family protein [Acetobacteraceae bacterium]